MRIRGWQASPAARRHMLEKHNVEWYEVDEVMSANPRMLRGRDKDGERRYHVEGRTHAGRPLMVVFRFQSGTAQVITAFQRE